MTQAHIVTDSSTAVEMLKRLLPAELVNQVRLWDGYEPSSAVSLASSLLIKRLRPVALVVAADKGKYTKREVRQQRDEWRSILFHTSVGEPFEAFVAVPTVEALLTRERATLEYLAGRPLADEEWQTINADPKTGLRQMFPEPHLLAEALARLPDEAVQPLQQDPLITGIVEFFTAAFSEREPEQPEHQPSALVAAMP